MKRFAIFNTHTSGNVHIETINGCEHLVTNMVSLVGDTVMNGILYPLAEVEAALPQLNMLHAPSGHPLVNGQHVQAAHPLAARHNVGAFIRQPRMEGSSVINEFCINTEVANRCDEGKEIVRRLNENEHIGVSTGLNLQVENAEGVGSDGVEYNSIGRNYQFDHVAVLLNQAAAGEHVGTAMKYNDLELIVNELSADSLTDQLNNLIDAADGANVSTWVWDVFPESHRFVYKLTKDDLATVLIMRGYTVGSNDEVVLLNDAIEVVRKIEYVPTSGLSAANTEVPVMAPKKDDPATSAAMPGMKPAANADPAAPAANADPAAPAALTADQVMNAAKDLGLTIITNDQAQTLGEYEGNRSSIDSIVASHNAEIERKRKVVAKALNMSDEMAATLSEDVINHSYTEHEPKLDYQAQNNAGAGGEGVEPQNFFINDADYGDQPTEGAT